MPRLALIFAAAVFGFEADRDFTKKELQSIFYADLGPEEIDVSGYPEAQQRGYRVFQDACSRCHTPARALFSPTASRSGWKEYARRMKGQARWERVPLSDNELDAVVDFLVFDGRKRKIEGREEFERTTRELQLRFWETIEERMRRLQHGPALLPRPPR